MRIARLIILSLPMRIARPLMLFVVLGLVTTVAVTWGLAVWLPQKDWDKSELDHPGSLDSTLWVTMTEWRTRGAVRRVWASDILGSRMESHFRDAIRETRRRPIAVAKRLSGPRWGRGESAWSQPRREEQDALEHASGWPVVAAWYTLGPAIAPDTGEVVIETRGGVPLPVEKPVGRSLKTYERRALPFYPVWRGLVIDVAFYGAGWAILFGGTVGIRRAVRRIRGRCPRCAYELTGLRPGDPCPECGAGGMPHRGVSAPHPEGVEGA